jgi:glutathione S-transferase
MMLLNHDLSPFAARVRLGIYAKELGITIAAPPAPPGSEELRVISPFAKIPVLLLDDGSTLPESQVILEYLDELHPARPLLPPGADDRARARLLARLTDLYLMPAVGKLFRQAHELRRDDDAIAQTMTELGRALDGIERYCGEDGYAVGSALTLADCALAPALLLVPGLVRRVGGEEPFVTRPRLRTYASAIAKVPAVARVMAEIDAAYAKRMAARQQNAT